MTFKKGDFIKLTSKIDGEFAILKILEVYEEDDYEYKVIKKLHPLGKYVDNHGKPLETTRRGGISNTLYYIIKVITKDEAKVDLL